jgi:hypothetical protein
LTAELTAYLSIIRSGLSAEQTVGPVSCIALQLRDDVRVGLLATIRWAGAAELRWAKNDNTATGGINGQNIPIPASFDLK